MGTLTIKFYGGATKYENPNVPWKDVAYYLNVWGIGNYAATWTPDPDEIEPAQTFGVDMAVMDEYEDKMQIVWAYAYPARFSSPVDMVMYKVVDGQIERTHAG